MKKSRTLLVLAAVLSLSLALPAAASAKTVTIKDSSFTTETAKIKKTARTVKRGTMTVKVKKSGYLKFTAPSKKSYSFTVSNQKPTTGKSTDYRNGFGYISDGMKKNTTNLKFSTKGGKTTTLWFRSPYRTNEVRPTNITSGSFLPTRTAKLTLKKGQIVYLYYYVSNPSKFTLKIK